MSKANINIVFDVGANTGQFSLKILKNIKVILCELSPVPFYEGQPNWKDIVLRLEREGFTLWAIKNDFTDYKNGRTLQMEGLF